MASLDSASIEDLRDALAEVEGKRPTQRLMAVINYLEEDDASMAEVAGINAIWAHSANPLAPSGAAGSSGLSTCCLARFLHCRMVGRFDLISPDGVQFPSNLTEISREQG